MIISSLETRKTTASDFNFVYELHRQEFFSYVEQMWGWKEEVQRSGMQEDFDNLPCEIVSCQGKDIGVISVVDQEDTLLLNYVAILPAYQRQGFGTQLLSKVLEQAKDRGIPVQLNVMRVNPAKAFYERLGFVIVSGDEALLCMEWRSS